jgi:hypothetical protein
VNSAEVVEGEEERQRRLGRRVVRRAPQVNITQQVNVAGLGVP